VSRHAQQGLRDMNRGNAVVEVILLEKIDNLGNIGARVKVKPGYGRNFLLPQGKATLATPENVAKFETMRVELERKAADSLTVAQARAQQLAGVQLNLSAKAGTEGKLFGSIGTIDIAEACTRAGVPVDRSEVRLPDGPIRVLGEHHVELHLHADVNVPLTVTVLPEE
jgi:large subunit ribosomal protein L9